MKKSLELTVIYCETPICQWIFEWSFQFEFARIEVMTLNETLLDKGELPGLSPTMK